MLAATSGKMRRRDWMRVLGGLIYGWATETMAGCRLLGTCIVAVWNGRS
jgi:hypothetical protein